MLGFVKFVRGYYLVMCTRKRRVGALGYHQMFEVEKAELAPLFKEELRLLDQEEAKWVERWHSILRQGHFYFSYTYELSRTVQQNHSELEEGSTLSKASLSYTSTGRENDPLEPDPHFFRFIWNRHMLSPLAATTTILRRLFLTVIHGYIECSTVCSYSLQLEVCLISRRSTLYAGTRFRKRGLNERGHCANEVETEQVVTQQHPHADVLSFVQIRGSVPLFWSQESAAMNFKPPIVYPRRSDPTFSATRAHIADLFERYGSPLFVVNLMRGLSGTDEAFLGQNMETAIPFSKIKTPRPEIVYQHLDMKAAGKNDDGSSSSVTNRFHALLCDRAANLVDCVGFFHAQKIKVCLRAQSGIVRVNCVDCLDRTNVLLFFLGREVFERQLCALGVIQHFPGGRVLTAAAGTPSTASTMRLPRVIELDSHLAALLNDMYEISGDALSMQYAGSVAHKKYQIVRTLRNSKEIFTSIQRAYNTNFQDQEKQLALNVFLGVFDVWRH
ncbi:unnamed protein product, partial [Amoebophrya sp. A25]|eukprot:GSA25T00013879001.1